MRTANYVFAVALLACPVLERPSNAQERVASRELTYHRAEENITVAYDPEVLPLSADIIAEITQSKEVAGAAAAEMTGEPVQLELDGPTRLWRVAKSGISFYAGADQRSRNLGRIAAGRLYLSIRVAIRGDAKSDEAEKFARLVTARLDKVLAEMSRQEVERKLVQLNAAEDEAERAAERAESKLAETRARVREKSSGLTESVLQELVSDLKKQQQALEVELAGMKGRAEALQAEVAKTADRVKKEPANDDVVRNLMRVIELRKRQLALVKALEQQGVPGGEPNKVASAEEQVALAEVTLAEAKRAMSRQATDTMEKLNGELSQIAVNMAENEAKLKYVTQRLEEHLAVLREEAEAAPLRQQLEAQSKRLASLQAQADQASMQVRQLKSSFRPTRVEIFDLKARDAKPAEAKEDK